MKKIVIAFISMITVNASAWDMNSWGLNYGVLGGLHRADLDAGANGVNTTAKVGFRGGVLANYTWNDSFSTRVGAIFAPRYVSLYGNVNTVELMYKYIDVPVLFQWNFSEKVALYAGPVLSFNIDDKFETTLGNAGAFGSIDAKAFYPQAQVGIAFKTEKNVGFEFYYERGFGDITDGTLKDYNSYGANFIWWL